MGEVYCPTDARYVAEATQGSTGIMKAEVEARGLFGTHARSLGWSKGRVGGADRGTTMHLRVAQA